MDIQHPIDITRRQVIQKSAVAGAFFTVPGLFAEELERTTGTTEGPFYPDHMPLDTDNDLLVIGDSITPAVGKVVQLTGKVTSTSGEPVRNAIVEIWQVDANGVYSHSRAPDHEMFDKNFQGFGRFETGSTGEYRFRTIMPVDYRSGTSRPPHIHYAINQHGRRILTTQLFIKDNESNSKDSLFRTGRGRRSNSTHSLAVDFTPIPGSKTGELAACFNIVI